MFNEVELYFILPAVLFIAYIWSSDFLARALVLVYFCFLLSNYLYYGLSISRRVSLFFVPDLFEIRSLILTP